MLFRFMHSMIAIIMEWDGTVLYWLTPLPSPALWQTDG